LNNDKPILTERELQVLQGIVRGELQTETASRLGISLSNVEKTVKTIKEKFDSPTPASAAAKAASYGIVQPK
jgi:two-component system, NarL family, response regulator YdfI